MRAVGDTKAGGTISGVFTELTPFTKLAWTEGFEPMPPGMDGRQDVVVTLAEKKGITTVTFAVSGIPAMIPAEGAGIAYAQQLDLLTLLVEAQPRG